MCPPSLLVPQAFPSGEVLCILQLRNVANDVFRRLDKLDTFGTILADQILI